MSHTYLAPSNTTKRGSAAVQDDDISILSKKLNKFLLPIFFSFSMDLCLFPPSSTVSPTGVAGLVGHLPMPMPSTRLTRAAATKDRKDLLDSVDLKIVEKLVNNSGSDVEMV